MRVYICAAIVAIVSLACSPESTSAAVSGPVGMRPSTFGSRGTGTGTGSVYFRIKIPSKTPTAVTGLRRTRPLYVSPATMSLSVATDGKNPVVANVVNSYASVLVRAVVGTHTFTVTAYDQVSARGNVLSTGTTAPITVPAVGTVSVRLTLGGVVARVLLGLANVHATIGSPATIGLDITLQDADGNAFPIFTGPGSAQSFAQAFTITSSDPTHGSVSQPVVSETPHDLTIAYDGANVDHVTFSARGPGIQFVQPVTLVPLPPPANGSQLIATGYNNLTAYATSGTNQILAMAGLSPRPSETNFERAAVDTVAQRAYVATIVFRDLSSSVFDSSIEIFDTRRGGRYPVIDSIQRPLTSNIQGIAIDSAAQTLYVSPACSCENNFFPNDIVMYSTTAGHALLGSFMSGFGQVVGPDLAVDPKTKRLFASSGPYGDSPVGLAVFSTIAPYPQVATLATGLDGDLAVDIAAGKLYALQYNNATMTNYVRVYDTTTLQLVGSIGPFALYDVPQAVAVDSNAHLLFVRTSRSTFLDYTTLVHVYGTGSGPTYPQISTFRADPAGSLTVAPYGP